MCVCLHQVVLTISQMMWCRDMVSCLEGDHDHFAALQEFELTNFDVSHINYYNYRQSKQSKSNYFIVCVCACVYICVRSCTLAIVFQRLNALAALVRGHLSTLHRNIITALITIDVHARDIVTDLVRQKVLW